MNNYTEFMNEVHQNAVDHGFWDPGPDMATFCALLHCEISEAMEEWRAGRPNVYTGENGKPEGIAVELADVALRILDRLPEMGVKELTMEKTDFGVFLSTGLFTESGDISLLAKKFPRLICVLHDKVHSVWHYCTINSFLQVLSTIYLWFLQEGLDFEATLRLKHEYNKTRPYKHGKKV